MEAIDLKQILSDDLLMKYHEDSMSSDPKVAALGRFNKAVKLKLIEAMSEESARSGNKTSLITAMEWHTGELIKLWMALDMLGEATNGHSIKSLALGSLDVIRAEFEDKLKG